MKADTGSAGEGDWGRMLLNKQMVRRAQGEGVNLQADTGSASGGAGAG